MLYTFYKYEFLLPKEVAEVSRLFDEGKISKASSKVVFDELIKPRWERFKEMIKEEKVTPKPLV